MSGIPCDHACATIHRLWLNISDYVDECFKLTYQEMIYSGNIHTLVTYDLLVVHLDGSVHDLLGQIFSSFFLPLTRWLLGRPRKHLIESQFMFKKIVHCSCCNDPGHNRANCNNLLPCRGIRGFSMVVAVSIHFYIFFFLHQLYPWDCNWFGSLI